MQILKDVTTCLELYLSYTVCFLRSLNRFGCNRWNQQHKALRCTNLWVMGWYRIDYKFGLLGLDASIIKRHLGCVINKHKSLLGIGTTNIFLAPDKLYPCSGIMSLEGRRFSSRNAINKLSSSLIFSIYALTVITQRESKRKTSLKPRVTILFQSVVPDIRHPRKNIFLAFRPTKSGVFFRRH